MVKDLEHLFGGSLDGVLVIRYGYVTPDDVTEILEQHIGAGKIIDRLWRYSCHNIPNATLVVNFSELLLS